RSSAHRPSRPRFVETRMREVRRSRLATPPDVRLRALRSVPPLINFIGLSDIVRNQVERDHKLQNGVILPLATTGALPPAGPFRPARRFWCSWATCARPA